MVQQRYLLLLPAAALLCCCVVDAFTVREATTCARRPAAFITSTCLFGGAKGVSTTLPGKKNTIETVKGLLDSSEMIFTVPASSLTVAQSEILRRSMPETTTVRVVKNKLMERALKGTEYQAVADAPSEDGSTNLLKGANMWFFIEDDVSATIKAYNSFIKDEGKTDTHAIIGGVLESQVYDGKGVQDIGKLPSKQELYAKIAGSINAVPTKLARVIKAPNSKLARAIKLATNESAKE